MSKTKIKSLYPKEHAYHVLDRKIKSYNSKGDNLYGIEYTIDDVIAKFGLKPKCYMSGIEFDLLKGNYHFDHFFPKSLGGLNTLDNMQVLHPMLNLFKSWYSFSEVLGFFRRILEYQGCKVVRPEKITSEELLQKDKARWKAYRGEFQDCGAGI